MIFFSCHVCKMSLSAEESRQGKLVRCPNCLATVTVPTEHAVAAAVSTAPRETASNRPPPLKRDAKTGAPRVSTGTGRRYGFFCPYCSSRLEATDAMAGQAGQCPTCGSSIVIPIQDRHGRLIDPLTQEIIKPDPHPVHAYAAAGERAPQIMRQPDGTLRIRCAKCGRMSPIDVNNCTHCGMPFTMEGTANEALMATNGFAVASLVLGIIGLVFFCTVIVPVLATVFGTIALMQMNGTRAQAGGRWQAIAGVSCGVIGMGLVAYFYMR